MGVIRDRRCCSAPFSQRHYIRSKIAIDRGHEDNSRLERQRRAAGSLICGAQSFPRNVSSGSGTRESFASAREKLPVAHGSINQESIRRHFILDLRSRILSHLHLLVFSRALFLSPPSPPPLSFLRHDLSTVLSLPRAILGDLYGQYRGGISTIGRTRVMLVADTTWLLVSK